MKVPAQIIRLRFLPISFEQVFNNINITDMQIWRHIQVWKYVRRIEVRIGFKKKVPAQIIKLCSLLISFEQVFNNINITDMEGWRQVQVWKY